jgi:SET domain-containing protein
MLHPDTIIRPVGQSIGVGVFATAKIPAGTAIWKYGGADLRVPFALVSDLNPAMRRHIDRYAFSYSGRDLILCGDNARYMNHSCDANCCWGGGGDFEIALADIDIGEELTNDYAMFADEPSFSCQCRSAVCRGEVHSYSALVRLGLLLQRLRPVVHAFKSVPQPLLDTRAAHLDIARK